MNLPGREFPRAGREPQGKRISLLNREKTGNFRELRPNQALARGLKTSATRDSRARIGQVFSPYKKRSGGSKNPPQRSRQHRA